MGALFYKKTARLGRWILGVDQFDHPLHVATGDLFELSELSRLIDFRTLGEFNEEIATTDPVIFSAVLGILAANQNAVAFELRPVDAQAH